MDTEPDSGRGATQAEPGAPPPGTAAPTPAPDDIQVLTADEARALRAERDAALEALDHEGRRERRRARVRRVFVGVLVVLFSVLLPVTSVVGWAHNLVLNSNGWVRTVGPLASDPAVTAAVSREVTNEIFTALDAQGQIAGALPPRASFLAAPITNGVKGYVQTAVNDALSSRQFQAVWVAANRFAHEELLKVLNGQSKALVTTNGEVVLNLVPLLNATLQQLGPFVSGVVGKPVTLPDISTQQVPAAACQKISSAIGRQLPSTCGQIPLFPADKLSQAQRLVRAFNRVTVLLIVVTPVLAALAVWISRRRRRTLLQLTAGGLLGLVVARRALWWLESDLVKTGKPENKAARQAIVSQVTHGFFTLSEWLMIGLAVAFLLILVTGPYGWARSARGYAVRGGRRGWELLRATAGQARDLPTVEWVRAHLGAMRVGGVLAAVILMLVLSVSFVGFIVLAAVLAAYELWLTRLAGPSTGAGTAAGSAPDRDPASPDPHQARPSS